MLFDVKRKIYYMAYEKVMGLPHPNLQTRRLKRLQKEQIESLDKGHGLLNKISSSSKKTSQPAKGTEIMLSREQHYNPSEESNNMVSNDVSEDPKTSSNDTLDLDKEMFLHSQNRRHRPSYLPNSNTSSTSSPSTNDARFNEQNQTHNIIRYFP